jgi:hypothetical protein
VGWVRFPWQGYKVIVVDHIAGPPAGGGVMTTSGLSVILRYALPACQIMYKDHIIVRKELSGMPHQLDADARIDGPQRYVLQLDATLKTD